VLAARPLALAGAPHGIDAGVAEPVVQRVIGHGTRASAPEAIVTRPARAPEQEHGTMPYRLISVQASHGAAVQAATAALASGVAVADGAGGLVFPAGLDAGDDIPGTPGPPGTPSTPSTPGPSGPPALIVQRAAEAPPPAGPGGTTAAPAPTGPPAPAGSGNLDDLAAKLYDRIRGRLKAELRLDRERAGLVTDLRG
jgi:hypothetical protein